MTARTFELALFELQRQSIARGFGGRLDDVLFALCDDCMSVTIYAFYSLDDPLVAGFDLPLEVTEAEFDPEPYAERLISPAMQALH